MSFSPENNSFPSITCLLKIAHLSPYLRGHCSDTNTTMDTVGLSNAILVRYIGINRQREEKTERSVARHKGVSSVQNHFRSSPIRYPSFSKGQAYASALSSFLEAASSPSLGIQTRVRRTCCVPRVGFGVAQQMGWQTLRGRNRSLEMVVRTCRRKACRIDFRVMWL